MGKKNIRNFSSKCTTEWPLHKFFGHSWRKPKEYSLFRNGLEKVGS